MTNTNNKLPAANVSTLTASGKAAVVERANLVPKWPCDFHSYPRWVNKALSWLTGEPCHRPAIGWYFVLPAGPATSNKAEG